MTGDGSGPDRVQLVLPAARDYISLARFAAGLMAVRANFNVEEVEDLQLAVDELYASSGALHEGVETTEFDLEREGCAVTISVAVVAPPDGSTAYNGNGTSEREVSWQLLSVLVDEHGERTDNGGPPRVWLRKTHPQ